MKIDQDCQRSMCSLATRIKRRSIVISMPPSRRASRFIRHARGPRRWRASARLESCHLSAASDEAPTIHAHLRDARYDIPQRRLMASRGAARSRYLFRKLISIQRNSGKARDCCLRAIRELSSPGYAPATAAAAKRVSSLFGIDDAGRRDRTTARRGEDALDQPGFQKDEMLD